MTATPTATEEIKANREAARQFVLANCLDESKVAELAAALGVCLWTVPSEQIDCPSYRTGRLLKQLFGDRLKPHAINLAVEMMRKQFGDRWLYVGH